jgi:hypothetical protein
MMFVDLFLIIVVDEIPTAQETAFPFSPRRPELQIVVL